MLKSKISLLIILAFFIFLLDYFSFLNPFKNIAEKIFVMPVLYTTSNIISGAQNNFKVLTFWKSGEKRIKNLELKNAELTILANKSSDLIRENELLKKQLNISLTKNFNKVEANVLEIPGVMVLDAGSNSNIKIGNPVIYLEIYIGKISKVFPNRSFVQLVTNSDSALPVKVGNVRGMAVGQFNNSVILDKIAQTEMIFPKDQVYTATGFLVGNLGEVKSKDSDLFKIVEIITPVDYKKLEKVFVIIDEN